MPVDASGSGSSREEFGEDFDVERLGMISGGDVEFERELAAEYLAQAHPMLDEIAGAIERGDASVLRRAAHTLKGSSQTVGAEALARVAAELERASGHADVPALTAILTRARTGLDATQAALDDYFGSDAYRKAA